MNNRIPNLFWCVFGIIKNDAWEVLFQKRSNTGYADGLFQIPAGHMELEESMYDAIIRKMKQELDITIHKDNLELVHIAHRVRKWAKEGFDIYFHISSYEWKIINNEPNKCEKIEFRDIHKIYNDTINFDIEVLKKVEKWISFSEEII